MDNTQLLRIKACQRIQKEQIDDIQSFFTITDTKTGRKNTWVPSISDLFGEDWVFVEQ